MIQVKLGVSLKLYSLQIFSISVHLQGAAIELDNNRFAIPVYKEFNNLNGRWFVFNKDGELIFVSEMTNDGVNLQPTVVPLSKTHALALYRQMHSPIKEYILTKHQIVAYRGQK